MNPESNDEAIALPALPIGKSWTTLLLAVLEALCVFAVTAAKAGLLVGSVAIVAAGWARYLHRDVFRIPILLLAILGAVVNLYLLWRFFSLRNRPAAAWRKRALAGKTKWRIGTVLALSAVTLALALAEIYLHRSIHHTIM